MTKAKELRILEPTRRKDTQPCFETTSKRSLLAILQCSSQSATHNSGLQSRAIGMCAEAF